MGQYISIFLKGMAMGIAEIIPGVSGGTIAFITGIYERFINALKSFDLSLIKKLREEGIGGVWKAIDGNFLVTLVGGMAVSILLFVRLITYLIAEHPLLLWAFFFGLIAASAVFIGRQISKWDATSIIALLLGTVVAYVITVASPSNGSENLFIIFLAGIVAISAMLLPGLSGSFVLLLLGMYTIIWGGIKDLNLAIVGAFAAGCVVGILSFARVLSWAFKNYRNTTLATLTGFMIGSLNRVWPWQHVLEYRTNSHGEEVPKFTKSILPNDFAELGIENLPYGTDPQILPVIGLIVVGFVVVLLLERFSK